MARAKAIGLSQRVGVVAFRIPLPELELMSGGLTRGRPSPLDGTSSLRDEILLAELLYDLLAARPEIEPLTQVLTSATFRFVPIDLSATRSESHVREFVDGLNRQLGEALQMEQMQNAVRVFESEEGVALRLCASHLLSRLDDPRALIDEWIALGRALDGRLRPKETDSSPGQAG